MSSTTIDVLKGTARPRTLRFVQAIATGILKLAFGLSVEGKENVPKEGPFIVVSNHLHNGDPVFIEVVTPRVVMFIAKAELFEYQGIKQLIRWVGAFPVHRGKMDRQAIKHAQAVLAAGQGLGIFPEGTRSKSMKIEKVLPGAGLFALRGDVPIVPVTVVGSERLPFNGGKSQRKNLRSLPRLDHRGVKITFGQAFILPAEIEGTKPNAETATHYMMQKVADMLPEFYRGIYGDSVTTPPDAEPA